MNLILSYMQHQRYNTYMVEKLFMSAAIKEAYSALKTYDVPIGCVAVKDGKIIARARNEKEKRQDATAHAELLCLQRVAKKLGTWRLNDVDLYTTLEPCAMCAGAMVLARIRSLYIGTKDPKAGAAGSVLKLNKHKKLNHSFKVKYSNSPERETCRELLKKFFVDIRIRRP
jgi:tRNA(adenine34) deaminase